VFDAGFGVGMIAGVVASAVSAGVGSALGDLGDTTNKFLSGAIKLGTAAAGKTAEYATYAAYSLAEGGTLLDAYDNMGGLTINVANLGAILDMAGSLIARENSGGKSIFKDGKVLQKLSGIGLLEVNFGSDGISTAIGMGGIDVGGALYEQVKRGIDYAGLKSYMKEEQDKQKADMAWETYVYGDFTQENTAMRLVNGKDYLDFTDKDFGVDDDGRIKLGETVSGGRDGKGRTITITDIGDLDTMSVVLGHEAYRDGKTGADNKQETRDAVIAHTKMAARMRADGADFSGSIVGQDLAAYDYARSVGNMGIMAKYADDFYDSSADFWKFVERKDGSYDMYNDGTDNVTVVDENGKVKRQYNYTGGDKAEFLSGVTGISADRLKETMSSAGWELIDNQWTNSANIGVKFGTELGVKLSNASATAYQHNGIFPSVSSVNVADNLYVNQAVAAVVSVWNFLAFTGNTTLNGLAATVLLPDYLYRTATGNGIPLDHLAATLAANTQTPIDDLAVSGYGLLNRAAASVLARNYPLLEYPRSVGNIGTGPLITGKNAIASVDPNKFSGYIFGEKYRDNGKMDIFTGLGYTVEDAADLTSIYQKQGQLKYNDGYYTFDLTNQYGQRVTIEIELPGVRTATGKTSYIQSGWMIENDGSIRLLAPFSGFRK
jgi:hypothetical protein